MPLGQTYKGYLHQMSTSVYFSRKPYTVSYKDYFTGEVKTIRRRPPRVLHDMLPKDTVELTYPKGEDWPANANYTIKHINPRQPNVLQLTDDKGNTTFVQSSDVKLIEKNTLRDGVKRIDDQGSNEYLVWP